MIDEMKAVGKGILYCLITAALFSACSESITDPATPGSGLLNQGRNVTIKTDTLLSTSDTTFLQRIAPDAFLFTPLGTNFLGKDGNYTAQLALRFYPAARDTFRVDSAKLTLRLITWRGNPSGTFAFTVHRIDSTWDQTTLKWPDVNSSTFSDPTLLGSFSAPLGADSQYISVNIDTALVHGWFAVTPLPQNYGILLKAASSCNVIRGIHAFDVDSSQFWPSLKIWLHDNHATAGDSLTLQVGADTYVADVNPFPLPNDHILTQAGIAYRSVLQFDYSRIPRGAAINSAVLSLERDPALSQVSPFSITPEPIVQALVNNGDTLFEAASAIGTLKSVNTFTFDVRRQAQLAVNNHNFGLILRQPDGNEYGTLDIFAFYGRRATNPALRPRIIVKYTVFQ